MTWLDRFKRRKKTWNVEAINQLADFIEDMPGTHHLGNIVWHSAAGLWTHCLHPMNGLLDRGALQHHLGISQPELYKMVHPITERAVPHGVKMEDLTRSVVINMLRNLAKTGKVTWNVIPKERHRPF